MDTTFRAPSLREFISDKLISTGIERSLETRELERNLSNVPDGLAGLEVARYVVRSAKRREALRLWLGWRLRPRLIEP